MNSATLSSSSTSLNAPRMRSVGTLSLCATCFNRPVSAPDSPEDFRMLGSQCQNHRPSLWIRLFLNSSGVRTRSRFLRYPPTVSATSSRESKPVSACPSMKLRTRCEPAGLTDSPTSTITRAEAEFGTRVEANRATIPPKDAPMRTAGCPTARATASRSST